VIELEIDDAIHGRMLLAFDGRVLERFVPAINGEGQRLHVRHIAIRFDGPNRRGATIVHVATIAGRGGYQVTVDAAGLAALQPLFQALHAAGATMQ
jgi:hypothetical protein